MELIERFGCSIYAYDPTPSTIEWIRSIDTSSLFKFFPIGIAAFNGVASFNPIDPIFERPENKDLSMYRWKWRGAPTVKLPVRKLGEVLKESELSQVDILKVDIEGTEYSILRDIVQLKPNQLLIELHTNKLWAIPHTEHIRSVLAVWYLKANGYSLAKRRKNDYTFILN